jgi:hypothetical protein
MKTCNDKYEMFKTEKSMKKNLARLKRTPEQVERDRELSRIRQQRYRDRLKKDGIHLESKKRDSVMKLTCYEREKKREYWREQKRHKRTKRTQVKNHD